MLANKYQVRKESYKTVCMVYLHFGKIKILKLLLVDVSGVLPAYCDYSLLVTAPLQLKYADRMKAAMFMECKHVLSMADWIRVGSLKNPYSLPREIWDYDPECPVSVWLLT